jgi:hypothetical protein
MSSLAARVAGYKPTGMVTSLKLIVPFKIARIARSKKHRACLLEQPESFLYEGR